MRRTLYPYLIAMTLSISPALAGPVSCYLEGTTGIGVSSTKLDGVGFAGSLDGLSSNGWLYAPGIGCDMRVDKMVVGLMGRYDFGKLETSASLGATSVNVHINRPWMVAAKLGMEVNPATVVYGVAGLTGAQLDLTALTGDKFNLKGKVIGGGVEWIISGPWSAKAEYTYSMFDKQNLYSLVDVTPNVHAMRVGFTYRFGGDIFGENASK
jgi:opacity protein-like surface antigen